MASIPPSDQMRASGSGRRKVHLKPGYSQLDWLRVSATFRRPQPRTISMTELRTHNTRKSAWLAVDGNVFDVTNYMDYHPGGDRILLSGAGKDATSLFVKYHAWVNVNYMLSRFLVGYLDEDEQEPSQNCTSTDENNPLSSS